MRAVLPALILPAFALLAACSNDRAVSLGRMGGAAPRLIITSDLQAMAGSIIGSATLTEELQADRIVIRASGLPEGRHPVTLHAGQCADPGTVTDDLPPLEATTDGKAELFADIPAPRLRGLADARLGDGGFSVIVSIAGQRFACAGFKYTNNSGAIDGD